MKPLKYILLLTFIASCSQINKQKKIVSVESPVFNLELTSKPENIEFSEVQFTDEGANFTFKKTASYLQIDSLPHLEDSFNICFWFKVLGENGKKPQVLFKAIDVNNPNNQFSIWVTGFRVTGRLNNNLFSSKDFLNEQTLSREFYDLPRLEIGKYYFFSVNKTHNNIQLFINGELYEEYKVAKDAQIMINSFILGVLNVEGPYKNQFYGAIRNFEIYKQPLTKDEIYSISVKNYLEIQPFNDAFELSKFDIDK